MEKFIKMEEAGGGKGEQEIEANGKQNHFNMENSNRICIILGGC
jgi:hypothetical protein